MHLLYSLAVGLLFGCGIYLLMRRSWIKIVVGIGLIGNSINLLVFSSGGLFRGKAPIIPDSLQAIPGSGVAADPLPQALVLTAIVIGFGAQVFLFILLRQTFLVSGSRDLSRVPEEMG